MARYSDEFRASVVVMLQAAGYPDRKGALSEVAGKVGVPLRTISRWYNRESNPPPDKTVSKKTLDLVGAIKAELAEIIDDFKEARDDADYRALITAFGILTDKLQLLEGKPTDRTEVHVNDAREKLAHLVNRHAARSAANGHTEPTE